MKLKIFNLFKALFGKGNNRAVNRSAVNSKERKKVAKNGFVEKERLKKNIKAGVHTCLVDPYNLSLPYFREIDSQNPKAFLFEDAKLTKDWLIQLIHKQHEAKILKLPQIKNVHRLSWEKVLKKLANFSLDKFAELASTSFKKGYVLILHNPKITDTKVQLLEKFAKNVTVVIVTKDSHIANKLPLFQTIHLSKPVIPDIKAYIWQELSKDNVEDPEFLENRLLFLSGSDPAKISELTSALAHKEQISLKDIRKIQPPPKMIPKFNLTDLLGVVAVLFIVIKGVALGKNNQDLYIIGAVGAAIFFMFFRLLNRGSIDE